MGDDLLKGAPAVLAHLRFPLAPQRIPRPSVGCGRFMMSGSWRLLLWIFCMEREDRLLEFLRIHVSRHPWQSHAPNVIRIHTTAQLRCGLRRVASVEHVSINRRRPHKRGWVPGCNIERSVGGFVGTEVGQHFGRAGAKHFAAICFKTARLAIPFMIAARDDLAFVPDELDERTYSLRILEFTDSREE